MFQFVLPHLPPFVSCVVTAAVMAALGSTVTLDAPLSVTDRIESFSMLTVTLPQLVLTQPLVVLRARA